MHRPSTASTTFAASWREGVNVADVLPIPRAEDEIRWNTMVYTNASGDASVICTSIPTVESYSCLLTPPRFLYIIVGELLPHGVGRQAAVINTVRQEN